MYFIFNASESAKALKSVKSCNLLRFAISGKFKEFFSEEVLLPNFISKSKFSEIALTVEETADLKLLYHPFRYFKF